jgi:acrR family transcriptional regulator
MKKTQNPSALRSRKEIFESLLKLMHEYPYSKITVKQIIMETSLAGKTFYLNFSSKDDALYSIIDEKIMAYIKGVSDSDDPMSVIFEFCDMNSEFLLLLHKNKLLYLLLLRLNEVIPECNVTLDLSNNPFSKLFGDLNPDYLIAFNIGAIWNVIFKWVDRGMVDSLDTIKKTINQYLRRIY